jgi:23S rRNA pseudouridine1911/1915/1917 synthase
MILKRIWMADRTCDVPKELLGLRFDVALAKLLEISRAKADKLIISGRAKLGTRTCDKASILEGTDSIVLVDLDSSVPDAGPAAAEPLVSADQMPTVFEDADIVVVDKPAGVAAHSATNWNGPTVLGSLRARGVVIEPCGEPGREGIVSRLDVGTSGLMLVCKSEFAYEAMREQFASHTVTKIYHALVQGNLTAPRATIEAPIGRSKVSDFRFTVSADGKSAVTHYEILERFHGLTLVCVNLETGRTHQIRVHFSSIGHPLVGDTMYGANPKIAQTFGLTRQWLHAVELAFTHPRTGELVTLNSQYPDDLSEVLGTLHSTL